MAPQIKAIQERYAGDQVNLDPSFIYFSPLVSRLLPEDIQA